MPLETIDDVTKVLLSATPDQLAAFEDALHPGDVLARVIAQIQADAQAIRDAITQGANAVNGRESELIDLANKAAQANDGTLTSIGFTQDDVTTATAVVADRTANIKAGMQVATPPIKVTG